MATSGTVGQTSFDVAKIVEHALRRCKIKPELQTTEVVSTAKESLYLLLLGLANRGLNLWCVETSLVGLEAGRPIYDCPVGTIDLLNIVYSQPTRATGTDASMATSLTTDLGASTLVRRIGVKMSVVSTSDTLVIASSSDDISYTTELSVTKTDWNTDNWYWFDLPVQTTSRYFKVSTTNNVTFDEFYIATAINDLPVSQWNRDSWALLNNKATQGRPSTNYYLEKHLTPRVTLWPVPNNNYDHLTMFVHRQIQDIGRLTHTIDLPQRWHNAIIWQLAALLCFELDMVDAAVIPIVTTMSQQALIEAEKDESDGAPLLLQPGISVYTR